MRPQSWRFGDEARLRSEREEVEGIALREGRRVFLRFDSPSRGRLLQSASLGLTRVTGASASAP